MAESSCIKIWRCGTLNTQRERANSARTELLRGLKMSQSSWINHINRQWKHRGKNYFRLFEIHEIVFVERLWEYRWVWEVDVTHIYMIQSSKFMTRGSTIFPVHNNYFAVIRKKNRKFKISTFRIQINAKVGAAWGFSGCDTYFFDPMDLLNWTYFMMFSTLLTS